jgi:VWFA-related protein
MSRPAAWLASILLLVPAQALTGAAPQAAPAQAPPLLRVTTHLVQVNVVVHGKKGAPVLGLTQGDFEITDAGVPQQIATLSVESMLPSPPARGSTPVAALPPNVFTNEAVFGPATPRAVTVILLDGLNTPFADQAYARQQLIKFLHTLTPNDRVALYTLGRDLRILHDFTDDPLSLLDALVRHAPHTGPELALSNPVPANTGDREIDYFLDSANQTVADFEIIDRVRTTLDSLQAIARRVAAIPGRKNLVWISGGFPLDIGMDQMPLGGNAERRSFSDDVEQAARAVTAAQLAIYPVDARGPIANPRYSSSALTPKDIRLPAPGLSRAMEDVLDTQATMETLAQRTGGRAYYNTNDLTRAIRGAMNDATVTYLLGYYPTHNAWDGTFHVLKVRVRRADVQVRHRQGYFAFATPPRAEQTRRAALFDAAKTPLDATGIAVTARLAPDVPAKGSLRLLLVIEPRHLTFEEKAGYWAGAVDVLLVQQAARGTNVTTTTETMRLNYARQGFQEVMTRGLMMVKDLNRAAAAYKLRVVVRDVASGNVGSVSIRTDTIQPLRPTAAQAADRK